MTCSRAWEIEAARDGRLTGKARLNHMAHLESCDDCARETASLESLAAALRRDAPGEEDELAIRRLRNRVLDAVDAERVGRTQPGRTASRPFAWAVGVGLIMAAAAIAAFVGPSWAPAPERPTASSAGAAPRIDTRVEVSAEADAGFSRSADDDAERIELTDGTLRLRVQRPANGRRVIVKVPDGEIADVGTVFEVTVTEGHTTRVTVEEGRVMLTLSGAPPLVLEAGNTWRPEPRPASTAAASARKGPPRGASSSTAARGPSGDGAAREDAAYLHALDLLHRGDEAGARAAASQYVHDFPTGFRRAEMARMARIGNDESR